MKTKLILSVLLFSVFFEHHLISQIEDETVKLHKQEIENSRNAKDQQMRDSNTSPFTSDQIEKYDRLFYFPIDMNYLINAQFTSEESQEEVSLNTSSAEKINLVKYGTVTFEYQGKTYNLTVFQNKNLPEFGNNNQQLFIPFTDGTTGKSTYENGRYLTIEKSGDSNTVILDFNNAMNPYSAYNRQFVSVIPPSENRIAPAMNSGERKFEDRK